jgi:hypothetical protein
VEQAAADAHTMRESQTKVIRAIARQQTKVSRFSPFHPVPKVKKKTSRKYNLLDCAFTI